MEREREIMYSKVLSCGLIGIQGTLIHVEADVRDGLPGVSMVGSLSSSVRESKERVITAIRNIGIKIPPKRITINFSPADVRKEGSAFDLPIAIAILSSYGYLPIQKLHTICLLGEMSLNGDIQPIRGILPMVLHAKEQGVLCCLVPYANRFEASIVEEIMIVPVKTLQNAIDYLKDPTKVSALWTKTCRDTGMEIEQEELDFEDIIGQDFAKRGAEISAGGRHNLLLLGAPGAGKSMIASRMPSIMPELSLKESLELTKIYSIKGELKEGGGLIERRPFRSPHHTITDVALVGGGRYPAPGEISMAHKGVLFLDELPEFSRNSLEVLRQPLEEKQVAITRIHGNITYPADILLLGAMNPCPCGYYPDMERCHCTPLQIKRYLGRISHPLLERIDLMAEVTAISYEQLKSGEKGESSKQIKKRVKRAVAIQKERYQGLEISFNSQLTGEYLQKFCKTSTGGARALQYVFEKRNWSARTYYRVLRVARTIADLDGSDTILEEHMIEAIAYRGMEQKYWG